MGKNKLARWQELDSFTNVIQPETADVAGNDHPIKGNWKQNIFKNDNPIILELGCGKGEYTIGLAEMFPEDNFIGIDIKGARMWRGAKTSNERKMTNVAFLRTRIEFIDRFFSEDEVNEIWITFPDPHVGMRNSNKRLTSPWYLKKYVNLLKNNGIIHLKTDNVELFQYTRSVVKANNLEEIFSSDNLYSEELNANEILSIKTFYEKQFLAKGMQITYLAFKLNKNSFAEHADKKAQ